jgi:DNA-binding CsgD family transcriptional regulator
MRRAETLRWRDARAIFDLLGEIVELGDDPLVWRAHMLRGLGELVGAKVSVAAEIRMPFAYHPAGYVGELDLGWGTPSERAFWWGTCNAGGEQADPTEPALSRLGNGSFTRDRVAFVDDRVWYRSAYVNDRVRPAGIDSFLYSHEAVPALGAIHAVLLYREWGEEPFSDGDLLVVAAFQRELGRLWRLHPPTSLPPRLRQTLAALRAGDSEKQAADRLGVSPATLHDYVKELHRRFGAHNRGELLARSARAGKSPRLVLAQDT